MPRRPLTEAEKQHLREKGKAQWGRDRERLLGLCCTNEETRKKKSEAATAAWKRTDVRTRQLEAMTAAHQTPESKAKRSAAAKKWLNKPGAVREGWLAAIRAAWSDAETLRRRKEASNDPVHRRVLAEAMARVHRETGFQGLNGKVAAWLTFHGASFEREYIIEGPAPFRYDFAFLDQKILLEVQGCRWHCCPQHVCWLDLGLEFQAKVSRLDQARVTYGNGFGWQVLTWWEHEPFSRLSELLKIEEMAS